MNAGDERDVDEVMARRIDAGLGEVIGDERVPDVVAAVLARHAAGDEGPAMSARAATKWRGLAALFLFGIVTVLGVSWLQHHAGGPGHSEGQGGASESTVRRVKTMADLEALPDDVGRVEVIGLGDLAAARLQRIAALHHVVIVRDGDDHFTVAGLRAICSLPRIESLELRDLPNLKADDVRAIAGVVTLRRLRLVSVACDDAALTALSKLPQLAELTLREIKDFGAVGVRAIASLPALTSLDMSLCTQLDPNGIAELGIATGLERLTLAGMPHLNDRAMMGLSRLHSLRELDVCDAPFTSMGLQALDEMRQLRTLWLSGNVEIVPSAVTLIPAGVKELHLARCRSLASRVAPLLRDHFRDLRVLDVADNDWLDDEALPTMLEAPRLEQLDVHGCRKLTPAGLDSQIRRHPNVKITRGN